jgi:hypothetical protein
MYAVFCIFVISGVWLAFITRLLINARRENEIKHNTQEFYHYKLNQLYGKIKETEEGEKAEKETFEESTKVRPIKSGT